jgi:hypothetical protein
MYQKIYDLCKVKNLGSCYKNDPNEPTPRVKFILDLLDSEGISYELDKFNDKFYNIILRGSSNRLVSAHHDIVNPNSDNANDNSCSIINSIALKKLMPHIHVVLLDGEEVGGIGSQRVSDQINNGEFGTIDWVLNLELTGIGGENFFIGNYPGNLFNHIKSIFDCPIFNTPYNDSVTFRKNGIDSVVINPLPISDGEDISDKVVYNGNILDYTILFRCHSLDDSVDKINTKDMQDFVEKVLVKILS